MPVIDEQTWLFIACAFYLLGAVFLYLPGYNSRYSWILPLFTLGLLTHTVNLALRWERIGHGPFINLYEILSSNVWSLTFALLLFMMLAPGYRFVARWVMPLILMLILWLLLTPVKDTFLPPTYNTIWLYFHVLSGKFFLGLLMLATALALAGYTRDKDRINSANLSYLLLVFALVFDSLMLVFGAVWAQDAWGRYWAWDPLETWAFLTWLSVVFVLHWRVTNTSSQLYPLLVSGCFVLAFLTFFGVPFISTAPHKGMI